MLTFIKLMAFVEPMYNVACRQMMSKCLESQYVEVKDRVQQGVTRQGYKNYLNLITDIWTSLTNEAIGVGAGGDNPPHFSGKNVCKNYVTWSLITTNNGINCVI